MNMKFSNKFIVVCMLTATCVLAACSGLTQSDKPVTTTWWLKPFDDVAKGVTTELLVPLALTVTAVPGLDTDQILTLSGDGELKPYAGARWADDLPELAASLIGRTLETSGRFDVLPGRLSRGDGGCDLQLELREFFADLGPQGRTTGVRVAIHGRLQCESAGPLIIRSSASVAVADDRMRIIVAAFQQAMDHVMRDMLNEI